MLCRHSQNLTFSFSYSKGAENGAKIEAGDTLLGDCKRDACAEAIVQCLLEDQCKNVAFSIISSDKPALSEQQWTEELRGLSKVTTER